MNPEFTTWLRMHCICFPTVGDHFKRLSEENRAILEHQWYKSLGHIKPNLLEKASQVLMEHPSKFRIMFDQHIGKILEICGGIQDSRNAWKNEQVWKRNTQPISECTKECMSWTRMFNAHKISKEKWIEEIVSTACKYADDSWYRTGCNLEKQYEGVEPTANVVKLTA